MVWNGRHMCLFYRRILARTRRAHYTTLHRQKHSAVELLDKQCTWKRYIQKHRRKVLGTAVAAAPEAASRLVQVAIQMPQNAWQSASLIARSHHISSRTTNRQPSASLLGCSRTAPSLETPVPNTLPSQLSANPQRRPGRRLNSRC